MSPVLVLCAHGTRSPAGRTTVGSLVPALRRRRPGLDVRLGFVDVQHPTIDQVVADVEAQGQPCVVVPTLFAGGYHVGVDVARAVASAARAVSAGPLGPHPRLVELLLTRLHQAGGRPGDAVVLAAAGSSRPESALDVAAVADDLSVLWPGPVTIGFGASARPLVGDAVAAARAAGAARVLVASYLLAPGFFHDTLLSSGADVITQPLGADPAVVDVVLDRYDKARRRLPAR